MCEPLRKTLWRFSLTNYDRVDHHQMDQTPVWTFFRHASVSSTYPGQSVRPYVRKWYFRISILSASLRPHKALRRHCGSRHGGWQKNGWHGVGHSGRHGHREGGRQGGQQFGERVGHRDWLIGPKLFRPCLLAHLLSFAILFGHQACHHFTIIQRLTRWSNIDKAENPSCHLQINT